MTKWYLCIGAFLLICGAEIPAEAAFPFSLRKQEIKTDYSQTMWDKIMKEQSRTDMRRGMTEMAVADYQNAANSFARAVVKNPKDPMPYLLLGASLYWSGKVDDAVSEYKEALSLDPKNALAYQLLGIAAGWKGDVSSAQAYFLKANALDPNKADTNMNLGSTYAAQHNWDTALDHFRRATELAPGEPLYHYQLGMLYEAMGRDDEAETSLKKALKHFSDYEDAQLSLGALYEKMNRPQEALKLYKRAVKTKPGDFVARLRYALLLTERGEYARAREVIEQSFSITRFKADGLALNAVYSASGNSPQAFEKKIEEFKKNLEKVSPSKPINIEVALRFSPVQKAKDDSQKGHTFEAAYQRFRAQGSVEGLDRPEQTFKRTFSLQPADAQSREQQIENLVEGLKSAVSQANENYQVNLSLQGRTPDYNAPSALTQNRTAPPKAVYDPRIVGNDMGLWVVGKTWMLFVEEADESLQEYEVCPSENLCELLRGLAALARGQSAAAEEQFSRVTEKNPQDALGWLGRGTAAVIGGQEADAVRYYNRALEAEPSNKTASKNLKILTD